MFFKSTDQDEQLESWADQLTTAIVERYRTLDPKKVRGVKYRIHLKSLRTRHGEEEVKEVLDWFCKNQENLSQIPWLRLVQSVAMFRTRYLDIRKAMQDSVSEEDTITDWARDKAKRLLCRMTTMPVEIKVHLALILDRTADAWEDFHRKMEAYCKQYPETRNYYFLHRIFDTYSSGFVDIWVEYLNERYKRYTQFTYPILTLVWSPRDPAFRSTLWRRWSEDWCGDPESFDSLLEELLK